MSDDGDVLYEVEGTAEKCRPDVAAPVQHH
jgi:hypothetical protein